MELNLILNSDNVELIISDLQEKINKIILEINFYEIVKDKYQLLKLHDKLITDYMEKSLLYEPTDEKYAYCQKCLKYSLEQFNELRNNNREDFYKLREIEKREKIIKLLREI